MRTKLAMLATTLAVSAITLPAKAQDVDALTKQANLELARANVEKARAEAQKAQIDVANNRLAPLKGLSGDSATVSTGEKTVEALLLNRQVVDGLAGRLVDAVCIAISITAATCTAGGSALGKIKPYIIFGSTPPDLSYWYAFQDDRTVVWDDLVDALASWDKVPKGGPKVESFLGPTGIIAAIGVVVPLLKTDTTIAGATWTPTGVALVSAVERALAKKGFGVDDSAYRVTSGLATADGLLGKGYFDNDLTAKYQEARTLARDENLWNVANDPKEPQRKAAAQRVINALAAYDALRKNLTTVTTGTMNSTTIFRMRQLELDTNKSERPLVYIINVEAAFTTTTKKGLFTGFGTVPAYLASGIVVDYVIVDGAKPAVRGSLRCVVSKTKMADVFAMDGVTAAVCQ